MVWAWRTGVPGKQKTSPACRIITPGFVITVLKKFVIFMFTKFYLKPPASPEAG